MLLLHVDQTWAIVPGRSDAVLTQSAGFLANPRNDTN